MSNKGYYKTVLPAIIGTALEWAEFTFFAYMAEHLSRHFFPISNPDLALLKTYGIFATSYFIRPLGAIFFGTMGDTLGRKPALIGSMLLMCLATTTIGLLPTYASIGSYAAVFLIICRLLQGLAVSGEFNGAAVFIYEQNSERPFFGGSLTTFAASAGMGAGALAAMLVSLPNAPNFAWRIPFLASGFLGLVALYLRKHTLETLAPTQSSDPEKNVFFSIKSFKENKSALIATAAMSLFVSVYVYIGNIYYKTISIQIGLLVPSTASQIVTGGQILAALLTLVFGLYADRIGGRKMCLIGLGCAVLLSPMFVACAESGSIPITILGQLIYAIINGLVSAPMMTLIVKQFPARVRFRGNALAWTVTSAIFGGTSLIVADLLMAKFGFLGPGLYISLASFVAFLLTLNPKSIFSFLRSNNYELC